MSHRKGCGTSNQTETSMDGHGDLNSSSWERRIRRAAVVALSVSALAILAACGESAGSGGGGNSSAASTAAPQVANISIVLKSDQDSGAPGTYTSKEHWPAFAPSDISVPANATVVMTFKVYDPGNTPLADGSPWNKVQGGTETVDGTPVTSIDNDKISHTFSIPELGLNAPLPVAPDGGFATVVFTFHTGAAGTYAWRCYTPCGSDPNGMGGAMATDSWMRGHLTVG